MILRLRINKSLLAYAIIEIDPSFDDCVKIAPSPRGLASTTTDVGFPISKYESVTATEIFLQIVEGFFLFFLPHPFLLDVCKAP